MTVKFENTNEQYGDNGPFEADSKENLADDCESMFIEFAESEYREKYDMEDEETANLMNEYVATRICEMKAEFIDGLIATYHGEPRVIFDNGGGITLQLPGYAHTYQDAEQCAEDIRAWIAEEDASDWGGNEEDAVFEPNMDAISNGGYHVETLADFLAGREDVHGNNASELRDALGLTMPETLEGLLVAMQNNHPCVMDGDQWRSDLPTFGGSELTDTDGVWSWNETHQIVGICAEDLEIVER